MSSIDSREKLLRTQALLGSKSPSLCLAKWNQVTLHLQNGLNHSCHHPFPHAISESEILRDPSALHNTEHKKLQRQKMLSGERPSECQFCWNIEDTEAYKKAEIFSDRITKSSEPWATNELSNLKNLSAAQNINPRYLELSFSSVCQFKCSYCSPLFSTKWQEEAAQFGPYPTSMKFNDLEYLKSQKQIPLANQEDNPFVQAFWKWWPTLKNDLHVLRLTGGEPLLSPNTFRLFEELSREPAPRLQLALNTNAGVPTSLIQKLISQIRNLLESKSVHSFHLFTSIDGLGAAAEYARFGLDYSLWKTNIELLLKEIPQLRLTFICTTNVFSVENYPQLVRFISDLKTSYPQNRITLDTNILRFPHHQNLLVLPEEFKSVFTEALQFMNAHASVKSFEEGGVGFYDFEINRLKRLVEYIKAGVRAADGIDLETARADFYFFVNEHDKRRKTCFQQVFPSLDQFYLLCKRAAEKRGSAST